MSGERAASPVATLPLLVGIGTVIVFAAFMLRATDGHFVPQVVDLYVVCQYAKALAEAHPFQYNVGDAPSTGSTSPLFTAVLAVGHAIGVRGEALVGLAILIGAACYITSIWLACRIARQLGDRRGAILAGTLVALGGPATWGYMYGSDIALFMLLSTWLLERLLAEWPTPRPRGSIAAAVLLALSRPEGLVVAVVLGLAWSWEGRGRGRGRAALMPWLPMVAAASVLLVKRLATGYWLGTSGADKSLIGNYGVAEGLALLTEYFQDVLRGLLLGSYPSLVPIGLSRGWAPLFFPPLWLFAIVAALVAAPTARARPLRLWAALVVLLWGAVSPNLFLGVHFNRYLMWAFPGLLIIGAVGLGILSRGLSRGDAALERRLFAALAVVAVASSFVATLRFGVFYGQLAGDVYRRDVAAAEWISRELPPGVAIANVATSVEYLTGHRNLNLHGVTSPQFFGNRSAEREAGTYEAMTRLPESERPDFLLTTEATQQANETLRAMEVGPALFRSTSFGDEILVHRIQWDVVGRGAEPLLPESLAAVAGLREVDRLNVCDSRDERSHGYRFSSELGGLLLGGTARVASYARAELDVGEPVIDAGRAILGRESFTISTVPNRDILMVLRTAPRIAANVFRASGTTQVGLEFPEAGFSIRCNGQPLPRFTFSPSRGWDERVTRIPAAFVTSERTTLELRGRYAAFYYWFYQ